MKNFSFKTAGVAAAMLMLGVAVAISAPKYDPMRAAQGLPATAAEDVVEIKPNPEFENLPDTPGVEETYYTCVACHSTAIIKQQRLSDARWDYLWGWMIKDQNMPEPDEETKQVVLNYLKKNFSSDR